MTDEERAWLKQLEAELYPPGDKRSPGQKLADQFSGHTPEFQKPREGLTRAEVTQLFQLVERENLVTRLFGHGWFGGIGIEILEHEQYPGTGPTSLLAVVDDHMPHFDYRTVYEHLQGVPPKAHKKEPGGIRQDVWDFFTRYSHSDKNREWLKHYGIKMSFDRVSYEY